MTEKTQRKPGHPGEAGIIMLQVVARGLDTTMARLLRGCELEKYLLSDDRLGVRAKFRDKSTDRAENFMRNLPHRC